MENKDWRKELQEIIDYLNSQAQPEERYAYTYKETPEGTIEHKIRLDPKPKDTTEEKEEWKKRYVKRFGYWSEEIKFIQQLLEDREREAKIEVLTEIFQTCYQEDSKTRELVEEKLAKLKDMKKVTIGTVKIELR